MPHTQPAARGQAKSADLSSSQSEFLSAFALRLALHPDALSESNYVIHFGPLRAGLASVRLFGASGGGADDADDAGHRRGLCRAAPLPRPLGAAGAWPAAARRYE